MRSHFDDLHDKYHAILTTKSGTRYERLAAIVFKSLEERNVVIHDLKMVGDSDVPHQIDVTIEHDGSRRRVVVECKDFDISGKKVGLGILRDFRSVVEDTAPDEAIVLTCNGFTRDAQKYAKAKKIKLAILRDVTPDDLEGLIGEVYIQLHIESNHSHQCNLHMSQENADLFRSENARMGRPSDTITSMDSVYFVKDAERILFTEYLSAAANQHPAAKNDQGRFELTITPDGWHLQVENGPPIDFISIGICYKTHVQTIPVHVSRVAELILSGWGDDDLIICGDQIERRRMDPDTGEIL